jgi:hypothetical protein
MQVFEFANPDIENQRFDLIQLHFAHLPSFFEQLTAYLLPQCAAYVCTMYQARNPSAGRARRRPHRRLASHLP